VAEASEFAVNTPVSPVLVLACEANDQPPDLRVDRRAPRPWCWRLGPVPCHESSVPPQHRFRPDDQKRRVPPRVLERAAEKGEDCSVGFIEPWASDPTLNNQDLVTKRRDLDIAESPEAKTRPIRARTSRASQGMGPRGHDDDDLVGGMKPPNHGADQFTTPSGGALRCRL
jgi:hypothetical protein